MTDQQQDVKRVTIVGFALNAISATRYIPTKELGIKEEELPKEIRAYFKGAICPEKVLTPFGTFRQQCRRELFKRSQPAAPGFVHNPEDAQTSIKNLKEIGEKVEEEKRRLIADWPRILEEERRAFREKFQSFPYVEELSRALEEAQPTVEYLERQISFRVWTYDCVPVDGVDGVSDTFSEMVKGLYGELLTSVSQQARETLETVYDAEQIRRPTIEAFGQLVHKVDRLSYLDERLKVLAAGMKKVHAKFPGKGHVPRKSAGEFVALLSLLSNEQTVLRRLDEGRPLSFEGATATAGLNLGGGPSSQPAGGMTPASVGVAKPMPVAKPAPAAAADKGSAGGNAKPTPVKTGSEGLAGMFRW